MAKYNGISGDVTLSGTSSTWAAGIVTNNIKKWSADFTRILNDSTSKTDAGFTTDTSGPATLVGEIVMFADDTTALSLLAGSADPTVVLVLKGSRQFSCAAKMDSLGIDGQDFGPPGATPTVTFRFRSQGTVTVA